MKTQVSTDYILKLRLCHAILQSFLEMSDKMYSLLLVFLMIVYLMWVFFTLVRISVEKLQSQTQYK